MSPDMTGVKAMLECIIAIAILATGMLAIIGIGVCVVAAAEYLAKKIANFRA